MIPIEDLTDITLAIEDTDEDDVDDEDDEDDEADEEDLTCLLYTSPSPRDRTRSRMPSSA